MKRKFGIAAITLIVVLLIGILCVDKKALNDTENSEANVNSELISNNTESSEVETTLFLPDETKDTVNLINSDEIESTYAVLIDKDTSEVLVNKNANERMYPASMTKVMTILVATDNLKKEDLDKEVEISIEATDYSFVNDCSAAGFVVGEKITVRDLLYATILPSGAEAAYQIALFTSGSMEEFVNAMNTKAQQLGISATTHFSNPVGIYDENNYSTAYDMAVIMESALKNDICKDVLNARNYTTTVTEQHAEGITFFSRFLNRIDRKLESGNVIGAKTGYVNQSRYCAVSSMISESGNNYICVTGGASKAWGCVYDHIKLYTDYSK